MATVTIHEAHLSKLLARVEAGEEIVIARGKEPVVRLEALRMKRSDRRPGQLKEVVEPLPDSFFFDPLPDDELALWNGDGSEIVKP